MCVKTIITVTYAQETGTRNLLPETCTSFLHQNFNAVHAMQVSGTSFLYQILERVSPLLNQISMTNFEFSLGFVKYREIIGLSL